MKISKQTAFALSLALNVTLGALLLASILDWPTDDNSAGAARSVPAIAPDKTAQQYYQSLSEKQLSDTERSVLLLAHLNQHYARQASAPNYWVLETPVVGSVGIVDRLRADVLS